MVQAFKAALADAGKTMADMDYRITDSNGEQYWFKEAALAVTRILRVHREEFEPKRRPKAGAPGSTPAGAATTNSRQNGANY